MRACGPTSLIIVCLALAAPGASAQTLPLRDILSDLFADVRLEPSLPGFPSHDSDFLPTNDNEFAPFLLAQAVTSQLATFPLATTSGGFTYVFDRSTGVFTRSADGFGPAFADRPTTRGRGRGGLGVTYQRSKYTSFEGRDLAGGEIQFYLEHRQAGANAFFEGDLIEQSLDLRLSTQTTTLFAEYGVTDRLDVAVVAPVVAVSLGATVNSRILRLATGPTSLIHRFADGGTQRSSARRGSATGLGDVLVRAKYRVADAIGGGVAAAVDVRLPTGDDANLLGAGAAKTRVAVVAARRLGGVTPHVNVGFTLAGRPAVGYDEDDVNVALGVEYAATPRLTLVGDLLGRSVRNGFRFKSEKVAHTFRSASGVPGAIDVVHFTPVPSSVNQPLLAAGLRFNPVANGLISLHLLAPLNYVGLRATITPVVSIDYSF